MSDLMRKIIYYETILEHKEDTKTTLLPSEVNNWQLCRMCLDDKDVENFVDLTKIVIMDVDGVFLKAYDMLLAILDLKDHLSEELPTKICSTCLNKLSTMYFFKMQALRAEQVLLKLKQKLEAKETVVIHTVDDRSIFPDDIDDQITEDDGYSAPDNDYKYQEDHLDTTVNNEMSPSYSDAMIEKSLEAVLSLETDSYFKKDGICDGDNNQQYSDLRQLMFEAEPENYVTEEMDTVPIEEIQENYLELTEPFDVPQAPDDVFDTLENESFVFQIEKVNESIEKTDNEEANCSPFNGNTQKSDSSEEAPQKRKYYKQSRAEKLLSGDFSCAVCVQNFKSQRDRVKHIRQMHPEMKPYKCHHCDTYFSHVQSLSRHQKIHRPPGKGKNDCNYCGKRFLRGDDLRRHVRVHTGERPYVCDICNNGFKQNAELKQHQISHSEVKLYSCDTCGRSMFSRNGLYNHKKIHDGVKNHICIQCDKRFKTSMELKSHMRVHLKK